MTNAIRCGGCGRHYFGEDEWNATMTAGHPTGYTCPECQTPEQNAEAEINDATLDYSLDEAGRVIAHLKGDPA